MEYKNDSAERRVWPGIQAPDGSTLELEPGEKVELPGRIKDPVLRPAKKLTKKEQEAVEKEEKDAQAAAAEGADTTDAKETT